MGKVYEVMDVYEAATLRVEQIGRVYKNGGCDLACAITDPEGHEVAHADFTDCTDGAEPVDWAREHGFKMTDLAAEFAERVIDGALCFGDYTVDGAASHLIEQDGKFARAQFIDATGESCDYEAAVELMDDDVREALHAELAPCTPQCFIEAYAAAHEERFGEEFAPYAGGGLNLRRSTRLDYGR